MCPCSMWQLRWHWMAWQLPRVETRKQRISVWTTGPRSFFPVLVNPSASHSNNISEYLLVRLLDSVLHILFRFFFLFFLATPLGMRNFPGQGSNLRCSSEQQAGSLTCWITSELPVPHILSAGYNHIFEERLILRALKSELWPTNTFVEKSCGEKHLGERVIKLKDKVRSHVDLKSKLQRAKNAQEKITLQVQALSSW